MGLVLLQSFSNMSLNIVVNELIVEKGQLCDTAGELLPSQLLARSQLFSKQVAFPALLSQKQNGYWLRKEGMCP